MVCSLPLASASRLLALTALLAACGPAANESENPGARPGGSGGSGSGGATGSGGSGSTGTGGSSATGTGGSGGSGSTRHRRQRRGPGRRPVRCRWSVTAKFQNQGWFADPELEKRVPARARP